MYKLPSKAGLSISVTLLLLKSTTSNRWQSYCQVHRCILHRCPHQDQVDLLELGAILSHPTRQRKNGKGEPGEHSDLSPTESWDSSCHCGIKLDSQNSQLPSVFKAFLDKSLHLPLFSFLESIQQVALCLGRLSSIYPIQAGQLMSMELSGNSLPLLDKFWTNKNKYKKFIPVKI